MGGAPPEGLLQPWFRSEHLDDGVLEGNTLRRYTEEAIPPNCTNQPQYDGELEGRPRAGTLVSPERLSMIENSQNTADAGAPAMPEESVEEPEQIITEPGSSVELSTTQKQT